MFPCKTILKILCALLRNVLNYKPQRGRGFRFSLPHTSRTFYAKRVACLIRNGGRQIIVKKKKKKKQIPALGSFSMRAGGFPATAGEQLLTMQSGWG